MKILILVIYSENDNENLNVYQKMVNVQRSYLNNFEGVSSYFIQMRELQNQNVEIDDDFIYVKGEEKLLNIMHKTVEAMDYLFNALGSNYDYILRTNISTIVNIPKLKDYFNNLPKKNVYTGGSILNLNWLDFGSGITDDSLFGTEYAQGTCIIISKNVVEHMIKYKKNIRYDVVDDISFGVYIKSYIPDAYTNMQKYKTDKFELVSKLLTPGCIINKDAIYYRNRIDVRKLEHTRYTDVYNMHRIVGILYDAS
jgi:hypothetical protein